MSTQSIEQIRAQFPILNVTVHNKPLVYLDNAATVQKPQSVIDAICDFYSAYNANVHRGIHLLSEKATSAYEATRNAIRDFIVARHDSEIIFTKGTTDGINLVASGFATEILKPGDEILLTTMEHHSNIVPWQLAAKRSGASLVAVDIDNSGELDLADFHKKLSAKTKLVAVVHVSNALGTINPIKQIVQAAHDAGAAVLVDGAQAIAHQQIDVQDLDCDFYAFSAHKMFGPTGFGALYGKQKWLARLPPYQGGGDMILNVSFAGTTFNDLPHKFEAGTPNISGAIATGAAIQFIQDVGYDFIGQHEQQLLDYGTNLLNQIDGLHLVGTATKKSGILAFTIDGAHPHDISTLLDQQGIAIRAGHHCTQPLMERYGLAATTRASLAVYNTETELDTLYQGLLRAQKLLI